MKYKNPPVIETVLSVQYNPIINFGVGLLGSYCKELAADWKYTADAPAVDLVAEQFGKQRSWESSAFRLKFSSQIDVRLQFRNVMNDRMLQIQNGKFIYNWLKNSDEAYPSYQSVRPEFDEEWDRFCEYVASSSEKSVEPNQWEVIYVNHMPCGTVWKELSDIPKAVTFLKQSPLFEKLDVRPRELEGEFQFEILDEKGVLYLTFGLNHRDDGTTNFAMTLMARGPIGNDSSSLDKGLELGHKTITEAFDLLTSDYAKNYWKD